MRGVRFKYYEFAVVSRRDVVSFLSSRDVARYRAGGNAAAGAERRRRADPRFGSDVALFNETTTSRTRRRYVNIG